MLTNSKEQNKEIEIDDQNFEMLYYCTSNRYVINGQKIQTQSSELHSMVNFPIDPEESFLCLNRAIHSPGKTFYYGLKRPTPPTQLFKKQQDKRWTVCWSFKNTKKIEIPSISVLAFSRKTKWVLTANGVESDLIENKLNTIDIQGDCNEFVVSATFGTNSKMFYQDSTRDDPCLVVKIGPFEQDDKNFIIDRTDYEVVYTPRNDMYYINGKEEPCFSSRAITNKYGPPIDYIPQNCCVAKKAKDYLPREVCWIFNNPETHTPVFLLIYFNQEKTIIGQPWDHHIDWTVQIDQKIFVLKPFEYNLGSVVVYHLNNFWPLSNKLQKLDFLSSTYDK